MSWPAKHRCIAVSGAFLLILENLRLGNFPLLRKKESGKVFARLSVCCAVVFAAIIVALMIAAAVAPWYKFEHNFDFKTTTTTTGSGSAPALTANNNQINSTKVFYDLNGLKTVISMQGTIRSSKFENYPLNSSLRDITKTAQAFVLIALIGGFILMVILFTFFFDRIRNKLIFAIGMTLTRVIAVLFCALILLSVIIAFLVYIGVVKAFKDDAKDCVDGPCRKFVDSSSTERQGTANGQTGTITESLQWGPIDGWFITICTTLPAIVLLLVVVVNKFPLPIDSEASSGEAL